ncbi:hypothetical protein FAES_3492 [Fibrella aestuarina BUZ 2]|uniref:Uncharacterized protein n=1 Tax=Fibrella aestuarina BUZ 2 TaxID=1166018 RepID=I0KBJ6_9BACT|nr:hypothetical protein FAES_3492 [Fibrella aestuarina BUZ 2]
MFFAEPFMQVDNANSERNGFVKHLIRLSYVPNSRLFD